jgi:staphyloferrin B biosynthesis citrate synthase
LEVPELSAELINPILNMMRADQPALGLTTRLLTGAEAVRIARASGHDFLRVDTQHAVFDLEAIKQTALAGLGEGFGTVVRVRGIADPDAAVMLDAGIGGLVFPNIDSAEQARQAVRIAKFPPFGERSYGGSYPHFDYEAVAPGEAMRQLNQSTLVACMIESSEGLDEVEAIASVPGVDVVHLGMSDLLISMGKAGRYDDPVVEVAMQRIVDAVGKAGTFAGCGGAPSVEHQAAAIAAGARFVTTRADANFLLAGAASWLDQVRSALSGR